MPLAPAHPVCNERPRRNVTPLLRRRHRQDCCRHVSPRLTLNTCPLPKPRSSHSQRHLGRPARAPPAACCRGACAGTVCMAPCCTPSYLDMTGKLFTLHLLVAPPPLALGSECLSRLPVDAHGGCASKPHRPRLPRLSSPAERHPHRRGLYKCPLRLRNAEGRWWYAYVRAEGQALHGSL